MNAVTMWLLIGAGFIVAEVLTAPGLGIFLFGLGSMCTALVVQLGIVAEESITAQCAWAFALTVMWGIALWKPLKNFRSAGKNKISPEDRKDHSDIVGTMATVGRNGLKKGINGQAMWSGTLMTARLDEHSAEDFVEEGTQVRVHSVDGTTLIVQPVHRS